MVKTFCDKCEVEATGAIAQVYVSVNSNYGCRFVLCDNCQKEVFGKTLRSYDQVEVPTVIKLLEELKETIKNELREEIH